MIKIEVPGIPKPKGSASAFPYKKKDGGMGANIVHRTGVWEGSVAKAAQNDWPYDKPTDAPVLLEMHYYLPRPKSVKPHKRYYPHVAPDIDKLERAVLDGLTGVVFVNDAQVVGNHHRKHYADERAPGVSITVHILEAGKVTQKTRRR